MRVLGDLEIDLDAKLTCRQAAAYLNVSPHVVAMWARRGWKNPHTGKRERLEPAGRSERGAVQYYLRQLLYAERDTRQSPKSHRRQLQPAAA